MNQVNYQKELDQLIGSLSAACGEKPPVLFLHSCCAPCSSYVLEYLAPYFAITVFYYNPNISADAEYRHRVSEQKRLIDIYNAEKKGHFISVVEGDYRPEVFYETVKEYKDCPEGGERCFKCYELRLRRTAKEAKMRGADYFGTTLTISPMKNAQKLNEIGERLEKEYGGIRWLYSDFKKKGGYQRSIELSKEYGLYRQDYCGCSYSKAEREMQKRNSAAGHEPVS